MIKYFLSNITGAMNTKRHNKYIIMVVLFLGLALTVWQINRALYKWQLAQHIPTELSSLSTISKADHLNTIRLKGKFIENKAFIQPRSNPKHQPGWQIWQPFQASDKTVIVSFGYQSQLDITLPSEIHGTIFYLTKPPFRLSSQESTHHFPMTVAQLDLECFSLALEKPIEPYIIVLDDAQDFSLAQHSIDDVLKHINYAGQFFVITLILCYYILRKDI